MEATLSLCETVSEWVSVPPSLLGFFWMPSVMNSPGIECFGKLRWSISDEWGIIRIDQLKLKNGPFLMNRFSMKNEACMDVNGLFFQLMVLGLWRIFFFFADHKRYYFPNRQYKSGRIWTKNIIAWRETIFTTEIHHLEALFCICIQESETSNELLTYNVKAHLVHMIGLEWETFKFQGMLKVKVDQNEIR